MSLDSSDFGWEPPVVPTGVIPRRVQLQGSSQRLPPFPQGGPAWDKETPPAPAEDPLKVQVQGAHYKGLRIQPVEYIHANDIPFCEGNVIKYVTRWRDKGGIKDLEKARHFIDLLINLESKK